MLKCRDRETGAEGSAGVAFSPVERVPGEAACGLLLVCDHASNALPPEYGTLGLAPEELERHIGYDIGAAEVTRGLAAALGAPGVLSRFSRLLIDPNRGSDDPTQIMRLSDGVVVPGNASVDETEIARRRQHFYEPYHHAIDEAIDAAIARGRPPALISIHSFTPSWRGVERPWQAGVLWDRDERIAVPLIERLRGEGDLVIGDNEPYSGQLRGDCMYRHGTCRGLAHALLEIRQDLIADREGAAIWVERLTGHLRAIRDLPGVGEIRPAAEPAGTR